MGRRKTSTNQTNNLKLDVIAVAARNAKDKQKYQPYEKLQKLTTLRDNPIPIPVPTNRKENNLKRTNNKIVIEEKQNDSNTNENTEKLKEIDLSVIAQPSINKSKKDSKEQRNKDIYQEAKVMNESNLNKKDSFSKGKPNSKKKHIAMLEPQHEYDINTDLNSITANITFAQLLDISPKLRSQLTKALKLKNVQCDDKMEEVILSAISKDDIATCECYINGRKGSAFLDTCASINIISRKFLKNLGTLKPFGYTTNNIIQITTKTSISSELYLLKVEIGKLCIQDIFRVIDYEQDLFDVLIGYKTLKENNLFINPINNYLCQMNENESFKKIVLLSNDTNDSNCIEKDNEDNFDNDSMLFCFINKINTSNEVNKKSATNTKIDEPITMEMKNDDTESKQDNEENNIGTKNIPNEKRNLVMQIIDESPSFIRKKFKKLLKNNIEILAFKIDELGRTKLLPHSIQIKENTTPIKQKCYRLSKIQAQALKKEIIKLIRNKLIEPSCSPWSSPVILVLKKNNKWRMCIDFRKLNNVTIKDAYSLPLIDDILFSIGKNVKIFTTLDLFSGFHQIPMNLEDIPKTSFTTMYGNYQFKVMPFGLCNAPGTFQREMNRIFLPLIGKCMFIYIDDLIIFSTSLEDHISDLNKVFQIIKENGLKINLEKCKFFKESVELLGHAVSINGVSPIPSKTKVIFEWLPPSNINQLQSFLGAVGYYRKFIFNFASIAKPLFKLLKKGVKFSWGEKEKESFEELKNRLITAPILSMPDFDKQFIIRTDASFDGIGGVLLQKDDVGNEKPIHFISRSLKPAEKNYGITDLEGTAAFYCVKKFKPYISGNKQETLLFTDHKPLIGLFKNKETMNSRQTRWVLLLSMLKVSIIYEPGKKNVIADALSRMRMKNEEVVATLLSDLNINIDNKLISKFNDKFIKVNNEEYFVNQGSLRKVIKEDKQKIKLILEAHRIGHEGVFKTYNRLKRDYYWVNMILDVKYFVSTCKKCQLFKPQTFNTQTENIPTKPGLPFTVVGLDIVGPLPVTEKGNQYIIVLVDYLTKWVEAEPTGTIDSNDVIFFLTKVFSRHGIPEILITDNGP